jgi:uncharacterized phage-associated protein
MAHSASDVAKWMLNYNKVQQSEADADFISNLKLQKLLYYAQGCYLAFFDTPLFDDEIIAWAHGPVVESVYHEYKNNGNRGIEQFGRTAENYSTQEQAVLKTVYEKFGQYSAWGLRNMTHNETPWLETEQNHVILREKIKDYFKENYVVNE